MQFVDSILYRRLTESEFIRIEGVNKPDGGGGQTYIDLAGIDKSEVRSFFTASTARVNSTATKTDSAGETWPAYQVPLKVIGTREEDSVHIDVRSGLKGQYRNYRISNQVITQSRHIAWHPDNGFPTIIGSGITTGQKYSQSVIKTAVSAVFNQIVVYIVKTKLGKFYSGFILGNEFPFYWPANTGLELMVFESGTGIIQPTKLLELDPTSKEKPFRMSNFEPYRKEDFFTEVFMDKKFYDTVVGLLERKKNVILQGSPGTGKTFAARRLAYSLMGAKDESCICAVQFHQSSSYEDFIFGYRPDGHGNFVPMPGIFSKFFMTAADRPDENFYLIIDEINRANVSKVFGEMLMAIEADHRNETVQLAMSNADELFVPDNVYIIGMMNTADRGLALIDYALRRRFAFVNMRPALDHPLFQDYIKGTGSTELERLVELVKDLNSEIENDPSLGSGFTIGHSYLLLTGEVTPDDVSSIIEFELAPLIREYWFDQLEIAETKIESLKDALS